MVKISIHRQIFAMANTMWLNNNPPSKSIAEILIRRHVFPHNKQISVIHLSNSIIYNLATFQLNRKFELLTVVIIMVIMIKDF